MEFNFKKPSTHKVRVESLDPTRLFIWECDYMSTKPEVFMKLHDTNFISLSTAEVNTIGTNVFVIPVELVVSEISYVVGELK